MKLMKEQMPKKLHLFLRRSKAFYLRCLCRAFGIFPIDRNKYVFSNFNGKGFGDNSKYLALELRKRKKGKIYWIIDKGTDTSLFPRYIRLIRKGSLKCQYHMATAGVWIDNSRKDPYYVKRKSQYYIQTWHGSIALKKIEKDVESQMDAFYLESAKRDSAMIDLMVSDSKFCDDMFANSFWYDGEIKRFGSPRLDVLFRKERISKIKKNLNISEKDLVILYAPTFRNSLRTDVYDLDFEALRHVLKEETKKEPVFLIRMHPNLSAMNINLQCENGINVNNYPDPYELLLISDILITDYSTLMFEFPVVDKKPVFCYAKDVDEYDRGFYFSLNDLPFSFAVSNAELIENVRNHDKDDYERKLDQFYRSIELLEDGKASKRTIDYLLHKSGAGR